MKKLLSIAIIWGLSLAVWGQEALVSARLDTNAILIGEQAHLELQLSLPQGQTAMFPLFADTLTAQMPIVRKSAIDTLANENTLQLRQTLTITSFDTGYLRIPPIPFGIKSPADSSWQTIKSKATLLNVFTVAVDTTKDIKPIVMPIEQGYTLQEAFPWILATIAVAIVLLALWFYWRQRQGKKPLFTKKEAPLLPPHEEAVEALGQLRHEKLWQQGLLKPYYTRLTDIVRRYIERRFEIAAMEMTSHEIMEALQDHSQNTQALQKLESTFMIADLVKFAKGGASAIENDGCWHNCIDFVNETKQVAATTTESAPEPTTASDTAAAQERKEDKDVS